MATKQTPKETSKKGKVDSRDNFTIITDELMKYGGPQKSSSNSRFVCCPFHDDSSPSMGVYMAIDGKIPLGFVHCFGCSTKGRWNTFAQKAGLEKIQEWKTSGNVSDTLITPDIEDKLLGSDSLTFKSVLRLMHCEEAIRWPKHLDWRGFDGTLIYKVGGHIINDDYNEDIALLFPIKIQGKVRGGVKAIRERKNKKQLAYVTMKGEWVRDYGLFPYMYVQKLLVTNRYRFVVLVEGPRDALRLVSMGIPALAMLGATSMSDVKALLVVNLDIDVVYVISDNDSGGDVMWKTAKKFLRKTDSVSVVRLKLPQTFDSKGELIKMDPGNCPQDIADNIIAVFKTNHNFNYIL